MKYLIGFGIAFLGFIMTWKADWLVNNFGRIEWAEEHLSSEGGTRVFYKVLGIIIILAGFLGITGGLQLILRGIFSPLTNPSVR